MDSIGGDILDQYRNISGKLKKRFLRKPNVTEACDMFTSLGQHCENIEMLPYAGMCWIASARCEGSLGNIPGETACLVRAARNFVSTEVNNKRLGCTSVSNENLQAALSCYTHAGARYAENCPLRLNVKLEMVDVLERLGLKENVETHLREAVELSKNSIDLRAHCLSLLASDHIDNGKYMAALDVLTEIADLLEDAPRNGARADSLLSCEISRVFLLLILRPTPQKVAPQFAALLEKYTWDDKDGNCPREYGMSEELHILLKSLVITCQSRDTSSLPYLEGDLWQYLNKDQKTLLRVLVRIYCR